MVKSKITAKWLCVTVLTVLVLLQATGVMAAASPIYYNQNMDNQPTYVGYGVNEAHFAQNGFSLFPSAGTSNTIKYVNKGTAQVTDVEIEMVKGGTTAPILYLYNAERTSGPRSITSGKLVIEFEVRATDSVPATNTNQTALIAVQDSSLRYFTSIGCTSSNLVSYKTGGGYDVLGTWANFTNGNPHKFKYVIDMTSGTASTYNFDLYYDDVLKVDNAVISDAGVINFDRMSFKPSQIDTKLYIDNFRIQSLDIPTVSSSSIESNPVGVSLSTSHEFTFNTDLKSSSVNQNSVKLYKNGVALANSKYGVRYDASTLKIFVDPVGTWDSKSLYRVELKQNLIMNYFQNTDDDLSNLVLASDYTRTFGTTGGVFFEVQGLTYKDNGGGDKTSLNAGEYVEVSLQIANRSADQGNACVIMALYERTGVDSSNMLDLRLIENQVFTSNESKTFTRNFTAPLASGNYFIKTFVWTGLDNAIPYTESSLFPAQ